MSILVGIDGTTPDVVCRDNASYDATFANSFVSRLCHPARPNIPASNKIYLRGPVLPGESTWCPGDGLWPAIWAGYKIGRAHV